MSPRMPCGRPSTPIESVSGSYAAGTAARLLEDLEDDAAARLRRRGGEDRAQGLGSSPLLADHLAEILLRDLQLEHQRVGLGDLFDLDLFGVIDQAAGQVVNQVAQRWLPRLCGSPAL